MSVPPQGTLPSRQMTPQVQVVPPSHPEVVLQSAVLLLQALVPPHCGAQVQLLVLPAQLQAGAPVQGGAP